MANKGEPNKLENSKNKSSWGGKRKRAGRTKGGKNKATLEKQIIENEIKQRVLRGAESLINAQFTLAKGCSHLFKIETKKYKDKSGDWKEEKKKPQIVESAIEIENYLNGDYDDDDDVYYFITTKTPQNKAIDSLIDRVFGKAVQKTELTGKDGDPINLNHTGDEKDRINNAINALLGTDKGEKE